MNSASPAIRPMMIREIVVFHANGFYVLKTQSCTASHTACGVNGTLSLRKILNSYVSFKFIDANLYQKR